MTVTRGNTKNGDLLMAVDSSEKEVERMVRERLYNTVPADLMSRLPTAEELKELRKLMEQDARTRWLWSSIRTWVLAISSIIALMTVGLDGLKTILRRLVA